VAAVPIASQSRIKKIGQLIEIRVKVHNRNIRLDHRNQSAVKKNSRNLRCRIHLQKTYVISTLSRYMHRIIKEATEIELHPKTGYGGWKSLIYSLKERRNALS
jgi:hypothetical protein